jgi:hypothetical protein
MVRPVPAHASPRTRIIIAVTIGGALAAMVSGVIAYESQPKDVVSSPRPVDARPAVVSSRSIRIPARENLARRGTPLRHSEGPDGPRTGTPPLLDPLSDRALQHFVRDCLGGSTRRSPVRSVQIDYPTRVVAAKDNAFAFQAVADARSQPVPPTAVIPSAEARAARVVTHCQLGAKLEALDETTLRVGAPAGESSGDGWQYKAFDESGNVNWTWPVTGLSVGTHELVVSFRPISSARQPRNLNLDSTVTYSTHVTVTGSTVEKTSSWVAQNKGPLSVIGGFLLAAVLGLLTAISKIRTAVGTVLGSRRTIDLSDQEAEPPSRRRRGKGRPAIAGKK